MSASVGSCPSMKRGSTDTRERRASIASIVVLRPVSVIAGYHSVTGRGGKPSGGVATVAAIVPTCSHENETRRTAMPGPLDGVRVVDLTTVMYGPYCTQIMGEMGADVIKVEPPGGDITRQVGPSRSPGMSAAHLIKGRNKRSLVLDLKQADAREALYRLAATADVFIHNMRPKAAESLGIGYDIIAAHRPDIVYCAATGFGEAGPYVDRPAYDDLIQGLSGLAALQGRLTGEPRYAPSVLADKTSGLFALYSIMMGLFHRERTGEGQRIHVPMYEAFTSFVMNEHMQLRVFDPPVGPAGYPRLLTKNRRPFPTRDGYVCLMPYTDSHWRRFITIAGRP
jgi:crotonobetainyl-CoA:carnitine CoA-transferase CaiB-like acyl-CoA transferase